MKAAVFLAAVILLFGADCLAEGFDYCKKPEASNAVDTYRTDTGAVKPLRLELPRVKAKDFPERVVAPPGGDGRTDGYRVMLIPVGYLPEDIDPKMGELVSVLRGGFYGVRGLSFSYTYPSVQLGFEKIERLFLPQRDKKFLKFKERLSRAVHFDTAVFVLNTNEYGGSGDSRGDSRRGFVICAGDNNETYFLLFHELGHALGLDDGYERSYEPDGGLPNTELFVDFGSLPSRVEEAYKEAGPPIENTGNFCNGMAVYSFGNLGNNIMANAEIKNEDVALLIANHSIFSEMQVAIMNEFVKSAPK